jgi:hypothetical protein
MQAYMRGSVNSTKAKGLIQIAWTSLDIVETDFSKCLLRWTLHLPMVRSRISPKISIPSLITYE